MGKCTLFDIKPGQSCIVEGLTATGAMRRRLLDIGLVQQSRVSCVGKSPGGDPSAYLICGAVIAIRASDARTVLVKRCIKWD